MSRLTEIEARLAEVTQRNGREIWHGYRCAYEDGFDCDCFRSDIVWLVRHIGELTTELAEIRDATPNPPRCQSRHHENEGRRSWRCDKPAGHPGEHRSTGGRRRWPNQRSGRSA